MLCGDWMEEEEEEEVMALMGIPISPPANVWPQGMMAYPDQTPAIPGGGATDHQQPPPPTGVQLKCPRCDSSNTKFCYYNNYSLSQPRHFCKACKRYWTRGGTLRNVPVGGGCRKNKRVKKPTPGASASVVPNQLSARMPPLSTTITAAANTDISSLFYGLPSEFGGLNCHSGISTYNFQPQLNPLDYGIGFSPLSDHYLQMQAGMQGYPFFGSSLPTTAAASLLVSSLKQQQQQQQQQQYEDLQVSDGMRMVKRAKIEDEGHDAVMNNGQIDQWQMPSDQISFESFSATTGSAAADNSSFFYWNQATPWPESANCGSSVSPLI